MKYRVGVGSLVALVCQTHIVGDGIHLSSELGQLLIETNTPGL